MDRRALFPFSLSPTPSNSSILSPGSSPLSLSLSRFVYPWKAPPCRRVQCEWPRPLCHRLYASIDTYLPIRAGAMLPISVNKCTLARTYDACRSKPSFSNFSNQCGYTRFSIRRSNEIMTPLSTGLYWRQLIVLYIYRSNFLFLLYIRTFAYSLKLLYQRTFTFILSYQTSNVECPPYFS